CSRGLVPHHPGVASAVFHHRHDRVGRTEIDADVVLVLSRLDDGDLDRYDERRLTMRADGDGGAMLPLNQCAAPAEDLEVEKADERRRRWRPATGIAAQQREYVGRRHDLQPS